MTSVCFIFKERDRVGELEDITAVFCSCSSRFILFRDIFIWIYQVFDAVILLGLLR